MRKRWDAFFTIILILVYSVVLVRTQPYIANAGSHPTNQKQKDLVVRGSPRNVTILLYFGMYSLTTTVVGGRNKSEVEKGTPEWIAVMMAPAFRPLRKVSFEIISH
jgi:hypothetical protein